MPPEPLRRGDEVGRYHVLEPVGAGGIGAVYKAYDPDLDRTVALKQLHPSLGDSEARRARLFREAQAMARLTHPNVVTIYDVLDEKRGIVIAMEFVEGHNLDRWLEQPRSLRDVLDVFIDCARGLEAAHAANICHRDCKPSNILVTQAKVGKLADFGLAAPAATEEPTDIEARDRMVVAGRLSADGAIPGTADFIAPEVAAGDPADPRSDQYSFCVALREALQRSSATRIPRSLQRVLRRGLDRDPACRFADMTAVRAALSAVRGRRRALAIGAGAGLALGGVVAIGIGIASRASPPACPNDPSRWREVWDAGTRQAAETAIAAAGVPDAPAASRRLAATLDDYTARWSAAYGRACAETQALGPAYHARSLCYELRREQVRALVAVVTAAEADVATALADPSRALDPLEPCARAQPSPASMDRLARSEVDAALADVAALRWAGRVEAARDVARHALAQADAEGDVSLRSVARIELGVSLMQAGDFEPAAETLAGAYWLAEGQADRRLAARAATALVAVFGSYLEQPTRAGDWVPRAKAAVAALDVPGREAFNLENALGTLAQARGDYKTARGHYERAVAIASDDPEITSATTAIVLENLATALEKLGRWEDAQARYDEARSALEREHGSTHPSLGRVLHNLAVFNHARGRTAAAVEAGREALAVKDATLPPEHMSIALTLQALGTILQDRNQDDEAEALLRRAERIVDAAVGREHPTMGVLLVNLAEVARRRGDTEAASRRYDEAIAVLEGTYGKAHELPLQGRAHRATLWAERGRVDEALTELQAVRAATAQAQGSDAIALLHLDVEIAALHREQGACEEATTLFARVSSAGADRLPDDHPVLTRAKKGLAACEADGSP